VNYCRCPVGLGNDFRLSTAASRARDQSNGLALTAGLEFRARAGSPDDQPGQQDAGVLHPAAPPRAGRGQAPNRPVSAPVPVATVTDHPL